jgi:hypothetical protein
VKARTIATVLLGCASASAAPDRACIAAAEAARDHAAKQNLEYLKTDQFVVDFKSLRKTHVDVVYATRERKLAEKQLTITAYTKRGAQRIITRLDGGDSLSFTNFNEGSTVPLDHGRFLDDHYNEGVFVGDMPDKGVRIYGSMTKTSPTTFLTTKVIRKGEADPVVIEEIATSLTAAEFVAAVGQMCNAR